MDKVVKGAAKVARKIPWTKVAAWIQDYLALKVADASFAWLGDAFTSEKKVELIVNMTSSFDVEVSEGDTLSMVRNEK